MKWLQANGSGLRRRAHAGRPSAAGVGGFRSNRPGVRSRPTFRCQRGRTKTGRRCRTSSRKVRRHRPIVEATPVPDFDVSRSVGRPRKAVQFVACAKPVPGGRSGLMPASEQCGCRRALRPVLGVRARPRCFVVCPRLGGSLTSRGDVTESSQPLPTRVQSHWIADESRWGVMTPDACRTDRDIACSASSGTTRGSKGLRGASMGTGVRVQQHTRA